MDQGEAGLGQHGLREPRDPADDVEADTRRAAERYELFGQPSDVGGGVQELAVEADDPVRVDGGDPVQLLGDVDADADPHGASFRLVVLRPPARAVIALHSDGSQSLISGRGELATPGDLPPKPCKAASLKTIPAPPPRCDPGMPGSHAGFFGPSLVV